MNDQTFALIWVLSFLLYLVIYTFWIPLKTQKRIETWLLSDESDDTLVEALDVIVREIRKTTLQDFEEFMLPRAKEAAQKFWSGAMGNAAKQLGKTEEGSQLNLLSEMTKDLSGQPWYVQAAASKFLPMLQNAAGSEKSAATTVSKGMGLRK
jgi:hypothetical protein|tara:strand:+ start:602 stop:1057 length:456 start_codon:yes stop_codon:yes gene_type:complete